MIRLEELERKENFEIDKYIEFREKVKKNMEHPEWLGDFTKEDLEKLIEDGNKIYVFYKDDIEVCSTMIIKASEKDILKFGLDIDYKKTMDYGPTFVSDEYRGNNLQLQMTKYLDNYLVENGYKYAVTTIHPDNIFSIRNVLKDDFKKVGSKEFKRGPREIYFKSF